MRPLDNSTSTDKQVQMDIRPGWYLINLDTADADVTIAVWRRIEGSSNDMPVAQDGTAISLTPLDSARRLLVGAEDIVVQRNGGSGVATVEMTRIAE